MQAHVEGVVRVAAGLSCAASAAQLYWLKDEVKRSLLMTQMTFLAFVNTLCFGWRAFVPAFQNTCYWVEAVYKYLIFVSVLTDIEITIGTLAIVRHWSCAVTTFNCRIYWLLLTLPVAGLLLMPTFISEAVWEPKLDYCKESPAQQANQFVLGAVSLAVTAILWAFAIFFAWLNSPRSVAVHYYRLGIGLFVSIVVCYVPFVVELYGDVFNPDDADWYGSSTLYVFGHVSMACTGLLSTLLYLLLRLRCCSSMQKGIGEAFPVSFGNEHIVDISANGLTTSTDEVNSFDFEPLEVVAVLAAAPVATRAPRPPGRNLPEVESWN